MHVSKYKDMERGPPFFIFFAFVFIYLFILLFVI